MLMNLNIFIQNRRDKRKQCSRSGALLMNRIVLMLNNSYGLLSNTTSNYYKLSNELQAYGDNSVFRFLMRKKLQKRDREIKSDRKRDLLHTQLTRGLQV